MNKYLLRGILFTAIGVGLCALGYYLMALELDIYKLSMAVGVVSFGFGFLTILYSLMRKIERRSFEKERKNR